MMVVDAQTFTAAMAAADQLARTLSAPLLFKGDDFTYTDVERWR